MVAISHSCRVLSGEQFSRDPGPSTPNNLTTGHLLCHSEVSPGQGIIPGQEHSPCSAAS